MEQTRQALNYGPLKHSSAQGLLDRVYSNPYDVNTESRNRLSGTTSRNFLNYFKGKMSTTVSTLKRLVYDPKPVPWITVPNNESSQILSSSDRSMGDISSSIQEIVSKPEYRKNYDVSLNESNSQKKTSFLGVVDVYKDLSAEKLRERMREKKTSVLPQTVKCSNRPVPLYAQNSDDERILPSDREYQNKNLKKKASSGVNKKRMLHSILNLKEKRDKINKKVTFCPKLERVTKHSNNLLNFKKVSSGVIKYTSSDEEEESLLKRELPQKKLFTEDKVIRNDPIIKLCLIQSKKPRANPFQKKYLSDKSMMSQSTMSEKAIKKMSNDDYYKPFTGKFNHENSFASDNFINDSKIETDSDESNLMQNVLDSPNLNILKEYKDHRNRFAGSEDLSEDLGKKSNSLSNASSKKFDDINEVELSKVDEAPIENSQEMSQEQEEEKVNTQPLKQQDDNSSAVNSIQHLLFQKSIQKKENEGINTEAKPTSFLFTPQEPQENIESSNKPAESKSWDNSLPKESTSMTDINQHEEPSNSEMNISVTMQESKPLINEVAPQISSQVEVQNPFLPSKEEAPSNLDTTPRQTLSFAEAPVPASNLNQTSAQINEEALTNPLFARLAASKPDTAISNNPFLARSNTKINDITQLIGGNNNSNALFNNQSGNQQQTEAQLPVQNIGQIPSTEGKPRGILELIGSASQSDAEKPSLFRSGSNTLAPVGPLSWLTNGSNPQETKQPNLFGGFTNNTPQASLFGAVPQGQINPFTSSPAQNNTSQMGAGMSFENNNSAPATQLFNSNNNTNSLFSGNNQAFNNNGGMGMMNSGNGLFQQNTGNEMTFGGNAYGGNTNGFLGMGASSSPSNTLGANPFTSTSIFGSGTANNSAPTNSLFMGGGSGVGGGAGFSADSGKKRRNQKDRAF